VRFVTEEFLADLRAAVAGAAGEAGGCAPIPGVTDVDVPEKEPHFDIEVISDAVTSYRAPRSGNAAALRADFEQLLRDRSRAFSKPGRRVSLLVNCGDLVVGRADDKDQELERVRSSYADVWLPAVNGLREAAAGANGADAQAYRDVLSVPGNEDAYSGGRSAPRARPYYEQFARPAAVGSVPDRPEAHPVATIFRVRPELATSASPAAPLAFVVVIGFDSNDIQYNHALARDHGQIAEEQFTWSQRLVIELRTGIARNAPLYVIAVTHHNLLPAESRMVHSAAGADHEQTAGLRGRLAIGGNHVCSPVAPLCVTNHFLIENALGVTSNASDFLLHCQQLRASLVIHGNTQQRVATTVATTPLAAGESPVQLTVLSTPAFAKDRPTSGMARISLNLWKGEAEIAFQYDTAPDGGAAGTPIQITRPLLSASRIKASERRLYGKVTGLIAKALRDDQIADREKEEIREFADYVADLWESDGYTPVSWPDGRLPRFGPPTRFNRYYLLLLLREIEGHHYEILLSRHNPLQASTIGEWDALLMPAFTSVRNLMERLHNDVVRQVVVQAEDVDRAANAKMFDDAVERIQTSLGNAQDDIWLDKMREIGSEVRRLKISPTSGEITEYEYHLVTLTPFVTANTDMTPDERAIVRWLTELPSLQLLGAPLDDPRSLPMEAVTSRGAGLRWEPPADPSGAPANPRKQVELPPGSVWFPLPESDETQGLWRQVPSIRARNADVMTWIDEQLAERRGKDGAFQPHVVLGKMTETTGYERRSGPFRFEPAGDGQAPGAKLATSTREAMLRVEYTGEFDLAGQHPYQGHELEVRRIVLVRRDYELTNKRRRDVILVFDADRQSGAGLGFFRTCSADPEHGLLGLLRPTQRYVLQGGLDRAVLVNKFLAQECVDDPWGFLRATFGGAGEPVALTPPIIEQVWWDDWDSDSRGLREFLVCDGNHRVVQRVWGEGQAAAAIGVLGEPLQPYYARPFSPYEWDITAENVVAVTPESQYKYAARKVDVDRLDVSQRIKADLRAKDPKKLFRRYYRNLEAGFGPMGGQGGKW
jgi:hypothetical protein